MQYTIIQGEKKMFEMELSDHKSELMTKEKELSALREDKRLLTKQFRQKKEGPQKRQQFLQKVSSFV